MFVKFGSQIVINTDNIICIKQNERYRNCYTIYSTEGHEYGIYHEDFKKLIELLECKSIKE